MTDIKQILALICFCLASLFSLGQNMENPSADSITFSSIIDSNNNGDIPFVDSMKRKRIPNVAGLIVYNTSTHSNWYNTGVLWKDLGGLKPAKGKTGVIFGVRRVKRGGKGNGEIIRISDKPGIPGNYIH